jgi:hypothetical protein
MFSIEESRETGLGMMRRIQSRASIRRKGVNQRIKVFNDKGF